MFAMRLAALVGGLALAASGCCRLEVNGLQHSSSVGGASAGVATGGEGTGGSGTGGSGTGASTTGQVICYKDQFPLAHRPEPVGCDGGGPGGDSNDACFTDLDCLTEEAGTRVCSCSPASFQPFPGPGASANTCVPGNCSVDRDCPCGYCSPTFDERCPNLWGVVGYFCHSASDSCVNDSDCDAGYCVFGADAGLWACNDDFCYTAAPPPGG
jgi:hypothetical protein